MSFCPDCGREWLPKSKQQCECGYKGDMRIAVLKTERTRE